MRPSKRFRSVTVSSLRFGLACSKRAGNGACALGPTRQLGAVEAADRATAGGHGVHGELGARTRTPAITRS